MERHRLSEERSLAYHRVIADRLADQPELLERARARVAAWCRRNAPPFYAQQWARILSGDLPSIRRFLVDPSERARELRQSSPFAGALSPRERWVIWRRVGEELGA